MSQHSKAECAIEYKESLSCLEKKGREACEEVFDAYKDCPSCVVRLVHSAFPYLPPRRSLSRTSRPFIRQSEGD